MSHSQRNSEMHARARGLPRSMTKAEYRWLMHFTRKRRRYAKVWPGYVTATSWG